MAKTNRNRRWLALAALCIAVFMSLLDSTIVNVALPTIQSELKVTYADLQWVINAYTLSFAMCLLLAAKFGDLFGRKKVFLISLAIFTLGSLFSSLSMTALQLNLSRLFQGVGGAGMMALSMTIVAETFEEKERGIAFGVWSSVVGVATALGPVIGGLLIKGFSWRSIFFINLPIGIIALFMGSRYVDETFGERDRDEKIDWLGMIISTAMIFCFVWGLVQKEAHSELGWLDYRISSFFVAGLVLLFLFVVIEKRLAQPMIDLDIFKSLPFIGTAVASFCLGAGLYAFFTYMTIWMQNYLRYSAEETGLQQLAIGMMSLLIGPIAGILSNRFAKRWLIGAGLILIGVGLFEVVSVVSLTVTYLNYLAGFVIIGIGNAVVNPPLSGAAVDSVERRFVGIASGVVNVFRQLGSLFGVVVLGLVLGGGFRDGLADAGLIRFAEFGPVGAAGSAFGSSDWIGVFSAFDSGFVDVLVVSIFVVCFGGLVGMLFIRDRR